MGLITDIDTANVGIMARLGKVFGILDRLETFQSDIVDSTTKSFRKGINEYISALNDATNTKLELADALIGDHDALRNEVASPILARCYSVATKTLIEMVNDETALDQKTVMAAMFELRRLMATAGTVETLDATTISIGSTAAASGNTGTGTILVSAEADNKNHSTMASYPTCRTETLRFKFGFYRGTQRDGGLGPDCVPTGASGLCDQIPQDLSPVVMRHDRPIPYVFGNECGVPQAIQEEIKKKDPTAFDNWYPMGDLCTGSNYYWGECAGGWHRDGCEDTTDKIYGTRPSVSAACSCCDFDFDSRELSAMVVT